MDVLRTELLRDRGGLLKVDAVDLVGSRPDTLVVIRYRHCEQFVGKAPGLDAGPLAESARLWDFAIDPDDNYAEGMMDGPAILAAAIGSAFDAAELSLVHPESLAPIGRAPAIFPRRYDITPPLPS